MVIFGLVLPAALFCGRDPDAVFIRDGLFLWLLIALSESDIRCRTLPDALILQGIVLWLLWLVSEGLSGNGECLRHLASKGLAAVLFAGAALMLSLLADRFFRKETLGGGDVKMLFMVVLYLGFYKGFLCLIIAAFSGFIFLAVRKEKEIPWGPFLAAGAFFALLFGEPVLKFLKLL
jgi:leader peptidase (prepilin peptidase)/N-methyltransferase